MCRASPATTRSGVSLTGVLADATTTGGGTACPRTRRTASPPRSGRQAETQWGGVRGESGGGARFRPCPCARFTPPRSPGLEGGHSRVARRFGLMVVIVGALLPGASASAAVAPADAPVLTSAPSASPVAIHWTPAPAPASGGGDGEHDHGHGHGHGGNGDARGEPRRCIRGQAVGN